ncbi:polyprenyl diphosphate synthase [Methanothermococcus okinawensis]|uniref:Tritrans,polycis-undecaprenyl-diphosphate synthase (geranylgeranyl-diphosphate specific) n=1 Tax=Methanothermococcus okinawensis (strain DSM 14208 / JCM 11175 / IH1) TaxID=647113 RepID=F8AM00_METOI|nr:polyprenyl diphosphate synthase [Methanothermococcus okinawensis]AEH06675.1 Undecaprenyl pyrophosphate synthase [Methanothermococcus okinawensis IH1]
MFFKIYNFFNRFWTFKFYEKILEGEINKKKVPKHIGVIMDGNRRMARIMGEKSTKGHYIGAKKVREFIGWCVDLNIKIITLYSFSLENFNRPKEEVDALMKLFEREFRAVAEDRNVHKYKIHIKAIGRIELLPENVREAIAYAENKTKDYDNYYVNVAIAYGGQQELVDAIKRIGQKIKNNEMDVNDISVETISKHLYTAHLPYQNPDLIIRTSGEERISNFLIWQSSYSELYFCETYWPNFRKIDFLRAIRDYQRRKRRFGK